VKTAKPEHAVGEHQRAGPKPTAAQPEEQAHRDGQRVRRGFDQGYGDRWIEPVVDAQRLQRQGDNHHAVADLGHHVPTEKHREAPIAQHLQVRAFDRVGHAR